MEQGEEKNPEVRGSLGTALANATRMLGPRPDLAELQAQEILKVVPRQTDAQLLLARALRRQEKFGEARAVLDELVKRQPKLAVAQFERGLVLGSLGEGHASISALSKAAAADPKLTGAWRALGDAFTLAGDTKAADAAYARLIKSSVNDPRLIAAASALCENKLPVAEHQLREHLKESPTDVAAIRMLAEVGSRLGRYEEAEHLLTRCLELAPGFVEARANLAGVLYRANKPAEAVAQAEVLLKVDPRNAAYRNMIAASLARLGESARAIQYYESVLKDYPQQPKAWMSYGHTLKVVGRQDDSIGAYRKSVALMPGLGEAWWSLANLKTFRFTDADVSSMRDQLAREDIGGEDRFHLHFALGKALEDRGAFAESFTYYETGNALRKKTVDYTPQNMTEHVSRSKALFTAAFFEARRGWGADAPDPVFIVGLPRSGSTLLEQILSSHSMIEGTMELPDIMSIAGRLGARKRRIDPTLYPDSIKDLGREEISRLGAEYLERTRVHRRLGRRFFTDKMPNNFEHIGLIQLILPNAKIIDARRHPLACCFSNFKQHFARGQGYTYDLAGMGEYYRQYVELMAHFDGVLPGRVHRVIYEQMVDDPETEVRALLNYLELPFEESCLKFYENERAVRTASSEQVRQPMYRDAIDHWRNYEQWLSPLKDTLGPVLDVYPGVPDF